MQHINDLAIGGHGAAGGEDDGQHRRRPDQHQHHQAGEDDGARHGVELLAPGGMGVEAGAGHRFQIARQSFDIGIHRIGELHHDKARYLDGGEIETGTEPGLEQLLALFHGQGARGSNARGRLRQRHGAANAGVDLLAVHGTDLNGDFAADVGGPGNGGFLHQHHPAEGHGGEKAHDGDHEQQRATGDTFLRHDRCGAGAAGEQPQDAIKHEW